MKKSVSNIIWYRFFYFRIKSYVKIRRNKKYNIEITLKMLRVNMHCATIYLEGRNKKEGYKYLKKTIYINIATSFIRKNLDNDIHKNYYHN